MTHSNSSRCFGLLDNSRSAILVAFGPMLLGIVSGCSNVTPPGMNEFASQGLNTNGVRMHQQGNYQGASSEFMKAIAKDPNSADGYYNLGATFHQIGRVHKRQTDFDQAEGLYNQCLDRNPDHVDCYRGLAVLLSDTRRADAAIRLIEGWSVRNPSSADPKIEMARLLEEMGEQDQAIARLEEALAIQPDNSRALTALGRLRETNGDLAQALANYQRSLAGNQMQPDVRNRVASLQAAVGGPTVMAPAEMTKVVRNAPRTARY